MPIKILITTGIFPPDIGGPATLIEQLVNDLPKVGFEITVLTYGSPEKKERKFKLFNVSREWPPGLRQLIFGVKTFLFAPNADIIYTTDLYSPGFFSMLGARFWKKKFIVRFAGDSAWETAFNKGLMRDDILAFQGKTYSPFIEKLKRRRAKILKSADAVIAVSDFMKNLAEKIGVNPEKIRVVYNAVDFFESVPAWKAPEKATLVYSGRLTPWKGINTLIRIVAGLKQKYPEIIFEILGAGPEMANLKKLARELDIDKNVHFRGRVSEPESHAVFSRSTIFVLNTDYEGFSHAILNAMNVGIPVITTPVGGNTEIIQDEFNGLLVPYNDEEAWGKATLRLLEDKSLRQKFSQNGKKTLEKFKWSDVFQKTADVFNKICEK